MGEIKSTLDIIMEKTKDMTLNAEERRTFREKEMADKLRGLLQKALDRALPLAVFERELAPLLETDRETAIRLLREDLFDRVDPWGDNEVALAVMEAVLGMDPRGIRDCIDAASRNLEEAARDRRLNLQRELGARGITGSAVLPNLEADSGWKQVLAESQKGLARALGAL